MSCFSFIINSLKNLCNRICNGGDKVNIHINNINDDTETTYEKYENNTDENKIIKTDESNIISHIKNDNEYVINLKINRNINKITLNINVQ